MTSSRRKTSSTLSRLRVEDGNAVASNWPGFVAGFGVGVDPPPPHAASSRIRRSSPPLYRPWCRGLPLVTRVPSSIFHPAHSFSGDSIHAKHSRCLVQPATNNDELRLKVSIPPTCPEGTGKNTRRIYL